MQRPGGDAAVLRLRSYTDSVIAKDIRSTANFKTTRSVDENKKKAGREKALALTLDSNSLYVKMEPYLGTVQTVAESMRNLAATGARPLGLAHCMNFGNPENYKDICDLSEAIRGLGDATRIWKISILAEEISLYNGTEGSPVLPTPAVLMAGIIEDINRSCSIGFKSKNDTVLLIGLSQNEIGCSEYAHYIHKHVNRLVPDINFEAEKNVCELVVRLINDGLLQSAHDLSAGGLAAALTECCMTNSRPIGVTFNIDPQIFETPNGPVPLRRDAALFSETSGRFLLSCNPSDEDEVRKRCEEFGVPVTGSGRVGGKTVQLTGAVEIELPLFTLYRLWSHRLENLLGRSTEEATVLL